MRKSMLAAIIAASALVPAAAFAQDDHQHDHGQRQRQHGGGNGGGEQHAPRQAQPGPQAQPAQQPRFERPQGQQQVQVQGQAQAQAQGNFRRQDHSGNFGDRGRGQQQLEGQAQAQAAEQQGRRGNGARDWRGGGDPRVTSGDARPQGFRGSDRSGNNWNGGNWRENDRRGPGAGTQFGRGGNWNRGWRQDQRYDWSRRRAENRSLFHLPRYYAPHGWNYGYRRFSIGFQLDSFLFAQNYWIDDPFYYDLPPAYGPYRWVRYYNDALLVDIDTGEVVDTVYDIFW